MYANPGTQTFIKIGDEGQVKVNSVEAFDDYFSADGKKHKKKDSYSNAKGMEPSLAAITANANNIKSFQQYLVDQGNPVKVNGIWDNNMTNYWNKYGINFYKKYKTSYLTSADAKAAAQKIQQSATEKQLANNVIASSPLKYSFADNFFDAGNVGFKGASTQPFAVGDQVIIQQNSPYTNEIYNTIGKVTKIKDVNSFVTDIPYGKNTSPESGTAAKIFGDYSFVDNIFDNGKVGFRGKSAQPFSIGDKVVIQQNPPFTNPSYNTTGTITKIDLNTPSLFFITDIPYGQTSGTEGGIAVRTKVNSQPQVQPVQQQPQVQPNVVTPSNVQNNNAQPQPNNQGQVSTQIDQNPTDNGSYTDQNQGEYDQYTQQYNAGQDGNYNSDSLYEQGYNDGYTSREIYEEGFVSGYNTKVNSQDSGQSENNEYQNYDNQPQGDFSDYSQNENNYTESQDYSSSDQTYDENESVEQNVDESDNSYQINADDYLSAEGWIGEQMKDWGKKIVWNQDVLDGNTAAMKQIGEKLQSKISPEERRTLVSQLKTRKELIDKSKSRVEELHSAATGVNPKLKKAAIIYGLTAKANVLKNKTQVSPVVKDQYNKTPHSTITNVGAKLPADISNNKIVIPAEDKSRFDGYPVYHSEKISYATGKPQTAANILGIITGIAIAGAAIWAINKYKLV